MALGMLDDGLAPTPPMGWNSWNRFGCAIDERTVLECAGALVASGMRGAGYRYVVVDDCWEAPERDGSGDLLADPRTFPSGIAALAERVHALGLRFGIYTDAGARTCQGGPGSLGYEFRDARRFAGWGVDYVKVDWCHTDGMSARACYSKWSAALASVGRPMVLSICEWGRARPWTWAPRMGHLWRTCWDIQDRWSSVTEILDRQAELAPYAGPGHWNDPDMLEVGNGGMSATEYRAHMSLWAVLAAPLMAGNDVRAMTDEIRDILVAPEVVAVDQDPAGRQGCRVRRDGEAEVWARPLADGSRAVVLLNRGEIAREIEVRWSDLRLAEGPARVRDLWARADLGALSGRYGARVEPHGVAMLRIAANARFG